MGILTVIFSVFALIFSFLAFYHTRERFRLDLLDKRWETYLDILRICSLHRAYGSDLLRGRSDGEITAEFRETAQEIQGLLDKSVRGAGWHKVRALFGPEIAEMTGRLGGHIIFFETFSEGRGEDEEYVERSKDIRKIVSGLPDLFAPYVYFGSFKSSLLRSMLGATIGRVRNDEKEKT